MTDVELDARVTALEENGGGNMQNGNKLQEKRQNLSWNYAIDNTKFHTFVLI